MKHEFKSGSKFKCIAGGHTIEKIDLIIEDGSWKNHLWGRMRSYPNSAFPEWLQEMESGLYIIDGVRFDIMGSWSKEVQWKDEENDGDNHPLYALINRKELKYYREMESDDDGGCSRCHGGGCPSCDTSGYFTGIKIYG